MRQVSVLKINFLLMTTEKKTFSWKKKFITVTKREDPFCKI